MSEQHTPGPWRLLTDSFIYAKDGVRVADPAPWSPLHKARTDEEILANTRLIEAAPELLEALKKVAQSLEWHAHGCCRGFDVGAPLPTNEAVELAKRTIAKAIGHDG